MKTTNYFEFVRQRPDRKIIKMEWIEFVVYHPIKEQIQNDGRIRRWGKIMEAEGKFLRVILLEDRKTIHNAFFDRTYKE